MRNKYSYKWGIMVSTVLIATVALCGVIYVREVTEKVISQNKMHVEEVTVQISENIGSKIEAYIHSLRLIGNGLVVKDDVSREELNKILQYEIESELFSEIIVVDINGKGIDSNNNNIYIGDREYFNEVKVGDISITDPIDSDIYNENVIVYSLPLKKNGKLVGAICGINNSELVKTQLKASVYGNQGCYYIINKKGVIILENHIKEEFGIENSADVISHNLSEAIKSKGKKQGTSEYGSNVEKLRGTKKYVAYSRIELVKDWYVVTTVPMANVFMDAQNVIETTIVVLFICIISVIVINLYIIKTKYNNDKKLKKAVYEDHLTEINNYEKFIIDGDKYLSTNNGKCALLLFDIEKFKVVNDIYGYQEGDNILKEISKKLQNMFNDIAVYGRLTGDSFALLIDINDVEKDIQALSSLIKEEIANTENMNSVKNRIKIDISIGVYIVDEYNDKISIQKLIDYADMAKLKSKSMKHVEYLIFDEEMRAEKKVTMQIEQDLAFAIENNEFNIFYQPKYDIIGEKIEGSEALIRWQHPKMGFVGPDKFIPIAEKNGHINEIGRWVFSQVCQTLMIWRSEGVEVVPVSVNLSRVELYQEDLIQYLEETLQKYNVPAELVELEITETTTLNNMNFIRNKLNQIKELGIKVSMDDFGIGNSNISNLKDIPIDILKIDKSILDDIDTNIKSKIVVESILNICKHLDLDVVAEGVENIKQVEILKSIGCRVIQGYVFYRPTNQNEYKMLLQKKFNKN